MTGCSASRTGNMAAYEYVLTGKVLHHWSKREANAEAHPHARPGDRARSELRACARLEGVRDRPGLAARLVRRPRRDLRGDLGASCERRSSLDDNDADVHRILAAVNI